MLATLKIIWSTHPFLILSASWPIILSFYPSFLFSFLSYLSYWTHYIVLLSFILFSRAWKNIRKVAKTKNNSWVCQFHSQNGTKITSTHAIIHIFGTCALHHGCDNRQLLCTVGTWISEYEHQMPLEILNRLPVH